MLRFLLIAACAVPWVILDTHSARGEQPEDRAGIEFFERQVRPLLAKRCYECHSQQAKILQGGLRLDSRDAILTGGDSGPALLPGKPQESLILGALDFAGDVQMPPSGKLPADEIALLSEWVRRGAPMPHDSVTATAKKKWTLEEGRKFWSFQPPRKQTVPTVSEADWPRRPMDAFVLAMLDRQKLSPSSAADRRTLIRRASFDLVGLPPSPEEVAAFVADDSPESYERLVERLLDSPHYGERWARYWLDLSRYSDRVASWLNSQGSAWLYRDWIVRSLNEDLPYHEFVRRQLAADQLDVPPSELAALGFLGLSPEYWKELKLDKEVIKVTVAEEWEERIDALGRTFLGLSLACARCHDHKFDPVSAEDYYALAGVLASSRRTDRYVLPPAEATAVQHAKEKVHKLQAEIKKIESTKPKPDDAAAQIGELTKQISDLETNTPHYKFSMASALDDAALYVVADGPNATKLDYKPGQAVDLQVQVRGNPSRLGAVVPRRFLSVFSSGTPQPFTHGSGRLDLADAIVGQGAPLSARVIVNRVWRHHFGRGLVETVSDFGVQGSPPSHGELLDDLTARFIENGWSLKWLHREIMLSATYRQASSHDAAKVNLDPENRYLWRMSRRRLDIEAWRDAMLAVTGTLDRTVGGEPRPLTDPQHARRTLYGRIDREEPDDMLRLHDFPDAAAHSPSREPTTTPLQQLFVLNSPLVQRLAAALAQRVMNETPGDAAAQVRRAYSLLYGREPKDSQLHLGVNFVTGGDAKQPVNAELWKQYAQVLLGSNEFLFVD